MLSHHPVFLLVIRYEGVPDLAGFVVPFGAHCVRSANQAGVFQIYAALPG